MGVPGCLTYIVLKPLPGAAFHLFLKKILKPVRGLLKSDGMI